MAKSITIRDVPETTHSELSARAAALGRSLQEYLRLQLIALADKPDPAALIGRIRQRKERTGSCLPPEEILSLRDSGRP